MPKFNNKENEVVTLEDGRKIWLSRASAVIVNVWYIGADMKPYILMGKRGKGCPDEVGKWVLPCGYLDHDETLAEAAAREIYEETGLDVASIIQDDEYYVVKDDIHIGGQPYFVNSAPKGDTRQNVSHYFGFIFIGDKFPALTNANCEPGEVDDLQWVPLSELDNYTIGFGHKKRIETFYKEKLTKKLMN